jgi:enoyl-[acyl-carrier protein] reductase I
MASERVVPGYGGGMSSAKAALESDVRGGPCVGPSRQRDLGRSVRIARGERDRLHRSDGRLLATQLAALRGSQVGGGRQHGGVPVELASGITGTVVYVDKGYAAMGIAVDREGAMAPKT